MAGVVEPSREPHPRHPEEPAKPRTKSRGPRMEGLAARKYRKTPRITPKQGRPSPKLAAARPSPTCWPPGSPPRPDPSSTTAPLPGEAHSPGSISPGSWACSGVSSCIRSPSCCPRRTCPWGWAIPGSSRYQTGWRRAEARVSSMARGHWSTDRTQEMEARGGAGTAEGLQIHVLNPLGNVSRRPAALSALSQMARGSNRPPHR